MKHDGQEEDSRGSKSFDNMGHLEGVETIRLFVP